MHGDGGEEGLVGLEPALEDARPAVRLGVVHEVPHQARGQDRPLGASEEALARGELRRRVRQLAVHHGARLAEAARPPRRQTRCGAGVDRDEAEAAALDGCVPPQLLVRARARARRRRRGDGEHRAAFEAAEELDHLEVGAQSQVWTRRTAG